MRQNKPTLGLMRADNTTGSTARMKSYKDAVISHVPNDFYQGGDFDRLAKSFGRKKDSLDIDTTRAIIVRNNISSDILVIATDQYCFEVRTKTITAKSIATCLIPTDSALISIAKILPHDNLVETLLIRRAGSKLISRDSTISINDDDGDEIMARDKFEALAVISYP